MTNALSKTVKIIILSFTCCLCVALFSCIRTGYQPHNQIKIAGTITDKGTNQPIPGISIYIDEIKSPPDFEGLGYRKQVTEITTDANGHFSATLNILVSATSIEYHINDWKVNNADFASQNTYLNTSDLSLTQINTSDFALYPLATLSIHFQNTTRYSDSDKFRFNTYSQMVNEFTSGYITQSNCGSVKEDAGDASWTGKDVCGIFNIRTAANQYAYIYWDVLRGGVHYPFKDSVYVARGTITNYNLNY